MRTENVVRAARVPVVAAVTTLVLAVATVASAQVLSEGDDGQATVTASASEVDCGPDDGRERLTSAGFEHHFEAPAVQSPLVGTSYADAVFPLTVDVAPAAAATLDIELSWQEPTDFDLFVYAADGSELDASTSSNIEDGVASEKIAALEVGHCDRITVVVNNWLGTPDEVLDLHIEVTPGSESLACVEDDPAPGCEGKQAGDAPDAVPDTRTRLYLGGDIGQASMVWAYANNEDLPQGALEPGRPTAGTPNSYTRPVFGFRDQYRNPFMPHFTHGFDETRDVVGDVDALVWVSSPTLAEGGTLVVDLYVDSVPVGSVEVPGEAVGTAPTPLHVRFVDVHMPDAFDVTLQLGTEPALSSNGPGEPGDALFTVHYGSVQFPSRVTLP